MKTKILIIIASKYEAPDIKIPTNTDLIISGQGKLNSYENTLTAISTGTYKCLVNLGICGLLNPRAANLKEVVSVKKVIQSDLTYNKNKSIKISPLYNKHDRNLVLASQDSPVLNVKDKRRLRNMGADIADMELYGIARAAQNYEIQLSSLKIISDNADNSSIHEIKKNIVEYRDILWKEFLKLYETGEFFNV